MTEACSFLAEALALYYRPARHRAVRAYLGRHAGCGRAGSACADQAAGAAFLIGVGSGTINPPSRNAGLQLAPEHSSTLAALRSMGLQVGSITTISVATAGLASTHESGTVQAWFYVAAALLLIAALPLITRVPEHHGSW